MIPEIYGSGPSFSPVAGANPTWQNLTNTTGGANGSITKTGGAADTYDAGATHNVAVALGDAFIEVIAGTGAASAGFSTTASPTDDSDFLFAVQWHHWGTIQVKIQSDSRHLDIGHWVTGDKFRIEIRNGRFRLYKNAAELSRFPAPVPAVVYPLYFGVAMYKAGAGVSNAKVQIGSIGDPPNAGRGGIKIGPSIVWTSGIRKIVTVSEQPVQGGKGGSRSQTVENTSYLIDLRLNGPRGPARLIREYANADIIIDQYDQSANPSGVYDPDVAPDSPYDPLIPPSPQTSYPIPVYRVDNDIPFDGDDVGGGTIQGGSSSFVIYPGNDTQDPDPTEEADVDAQYGAGSTTAHRDVAGTVHTNFDLSRWGGIVPNFNQVWEHATLKTLDTIYGSLCERVNVLAANDDYDFTGLSAIASRGMRIAGRLFQPAEIMDSPEIQLAYSYFVTEAEGQIVGYAEGDEPTLTIDDTEVGWLDGESDVPDIIPELDSILASEINLPREMIVKSISPDDDWDLNTQTARRQITEGVTTELLEIEIAQLNDERRATAQRGLYRKYVAGTAHKFTLPWTYLYIFPGYKIIINRAEGFTHTFRLTQFDGGIGVCNCEGVALEPETFNQPATGSTSPGYVPPQAIPAMTVMSLLDTPLLRDGDITNNDGVGWYVVGTPRTGFDQAWPGFNLLMFKNNEWGFKAESRLPGTIGTVVSVTSLSTDPTTIDAVGEIVVDLYGTTQTLSSVTEPDIEGGANLALAGGMVFNFADAVQEAGFPNRWTLTTLLNGQKGTDHLISAVAADDRFVLLNEAVKFVPMEIEDLNVEYDYRAVTVGQSLDDAATIPAVWTGEGLRESKVTDLNAVVDASGNWHVSAVGHPRRLPANYNLRLRRPSDDVIMRDIPISTGGTQAAVFPDTFGNIEVTNNNLETGAVVPFVFTAVAATDVITAVGNTIPNGSFVRVSNSGGALPAPLVAGTTYYKRDTAGDTFKLAVNPFAAAIDLTTNGTGTSSVWQVLEATGARTAQEITGPGAFLEFVLPALDTLPGGSLNLGLFESADAGWTNTSAWTAGVYTLRMVVTDTVTGEWAIYFWDVGGEDAGQVLASDLSVGLGPVKIRLTFSGTELRVYKNWVNSSTAPIVISKVPPAEHFPMKAAFYLVSGEANSDAARVQQVVIGGMSNPSTVYSVAQQDQDNGAPLTSIDAEMWQTGLVPGQSVRDEFP